MGFAIVADFPLGTYRGRRGDGSTDPLPSPARLHAALLAAAGQGPRAERHGDALAPADADRAALAWLEAHPPDAISVPPLRAGTSPTAAYRPEGFFRTRPGGRRVLETRLDPLDGVAVGGSLGWIWDEAPPDGVAAAIEALCADVSHLGSADSPVILRIGTPAATHRLDPRARLADTSGMEVEVAEPGRTTSLERAFVTGNGGPPSARADRPARSEAAAVRPVERAALRRARYVPAVGPPPAAPWSNVVLLPIDRRLAPATRVAWAVALHRAVISRIGAGAPALVTGRYERGVPRPTNRLAIQYLPGSLPAAPVLGTAGALALLIPAGAEPEDLAALDRAIRGLTEVGLGGGRAIRLQHAPIVLPGDAVWAPVSAGHIRTWVTATPAIPETRPLRGHPWTIGDAALLSLGLVFRERFPHPASRREWYASLVSAVVGTGVVVVEAHKLHEGDLRRWVHRVSTETAVQPYRVALRLGTLAGDRTILAIGQSRHLGGGLLVPVDLPEAYPG